MVNNMNPLVTFTQAFIPKTLDQVEDYERDQERMKTGKDTEGIYYQTITGLREDLSGVRLSSDHAQDAKDLATIGVFSDDEDDDDDDDDEDLNEDLHVQQTKPDDAKDIVTSRIQNGVEDIDGASKDVARPAEDQTPDAKDLATSGGHNGDEDDDDGASENSEDDDSSDDEGEADSAPRDPKKEAARLARKENKKKVKAEKRESRKTKLPKALKKKKKKLAKSKCTR